MHGAIVYANILVDVKPSHICLIRAVGGAGGVGGWDGAVEWDGRACGGVWLGVGGVARGE